MQHENGEGYMHSNCVLYSDAMHIAHLYVNLSITSFVLNRSYECLCYSADHHYFQNTFEKISLSVRIKRELIF